MIAPYYEGGGITLFCADCRQVLDEWAGLRAQSFDLLLTDPPYGIAFPGRPTKWQRAKGATPEAWDDQPADPEVLALARIICRQAIIWGGHYFDLPRGRCWLAWVKPDAPPSIGSVEYAWTTLDRTARYMVHSIGAGNAERCGHPTQKPEAVMRWCLALALDAQPVRTVLDPYAGSGTTLVAARRLGLTAVGIERDERYCALAAARLAQAALPFGSDRCA